MGLCLSGRFGEKLLEIFEQIGGAAKELGYLSVNVLNGFRLSLIGLEDLQELLVDLRVLGKSILRK